MRFLTICAGGGLVDIGINQAGHQTVAAIERETWIAETFKLNFPEVEMVNEDCTTVDYDRFKDYGIDAIWASFPCQDSSIARSKLLPRHKDADCGYSLIDAVESLQPRYIFLENVPQWGKTVVWSDVRDYLFNQGYWVSECVLNAADYGVPQNRKRLIIRCVKSGFLPSLPSKSERVGWYQAIADLIPDCPISQLTNWQKELIDKNGGLDYFNPVLIPHVGARKNSFRLIGKDEPSPTIRALGGDRHYRQFDFSDGCYIKQLTIECEARLQTMPDDYNFGSLLNYQKKKIIGNGVPCLLVKQILKGY